MINFDSIRHNITIIAAVEASLGVSDRSGILGWPKVAKKCSIPNDPPTVQHGESSRAQEESFSFYISA